MDKDKEFSSAYLDLLKEVGTISSGRAATALSEMLNCRVEISLPEIKIVPLENIDKILGSPEDLYFVLDTGITGDLKGRVFFLLCPKEAKILASSLLGKDAKDIDNNDPLFQSSLKEVINILSGSYIIALSEMTHLTMSYTIPSLAIDMVAAILDFIFIQIAQNAEEALFIKTNLNVENINFEGILLFFPESEAVKKILDTLGISE